MKNIYILLLFSGFIFSLHSQTKISGFVYSAEDSVVLPGANIYLPEIRKGTITDTSGKFEIGNLPISGIVTVQASYMGYQTKIRVFDLKKNEALIFKLDPEIFHSQEVVITSGAYTTQHENAIKIESVSRELEIPSEISIYEYFTKIPGVEVINKGSIKKPVIRGLSNNNILVLQNGVRLENYQFSENHPFIINDFSNKKVEVIKGPASLLYGSDAVGGIINIIPKDPPPVNTISANYIQQYHTNTQGIATHIDIGFTKNDISAGFNSNFNNHKDYFSGNGLIIPNSRNNKKHFSAFTSLNKSAGSFQIRYDYNGLKAGMPVAGIDTLVNTNERKNNFWYQDLDHHIISSENTLFLKNHRLYLNINYQENLRKLWLIDERGANMKLRNIGSEMKVKTHINESIDLIWGYQGVLQFNQNGPAHNRVLPDYKLFDHSLFGLLQNKIGKNIHLQAGGRVDFRLLDIPEQERSSHSHEEENENEEEPEEILPELKRKYSNISGSAGLTWNINEHLLFRSNLSSAFRTPNIAELTQEGIHGSRFEEGNRNLNSQRNYEADMSIHFHNNFMMIDLAGFYNYIEDYIFLSPTDQFTENNLAIYRYMQENAIIRGFESSFGISPHHKATIDLTYSFISANRFNSDPLPLIPQNKFRTNISLEPGKLWIFRDNLLKFGFLYAFKKDNVSEFETRSGNYYIFDINLRTKLNLQKTKMTAGIKIHNIFDHNYMDHLSTLKELGYYNMGRNISFYIKIPLTIELKD